MAGGRLRAEAPPRPPSSQRGRDGRLAPTPSPEGTCRTPSRSRRPSRTPREKSVATEEAASRAPSCSRLGAFRSPREKIVVTEEDFRRCGGDLEQLRRCHKPYDPSGQPAREDSFQEAFEKRCREPVDKLRDPWKDIGDPERTRQIGAEDCLFNQVLPSALPSTPSTTEELPSLKSRSRSCSERRSCSRDSRTSAGASREGRLGSSTARSSSRASSRAPRTGRPGLPAVGGLPPIMPPLMSSWSAAGRAAVYR